MRRRTLLASALGLVCLPQSLTAQGAFQGNTTKMSRVGWLTAQQPSSLDPYIPALRTGLAELGYEEGRTVLIEYRYGHDSVERVPELAAALERLPVALMIVQGAAVAIVQKLNLSVPVVYVTSGDPVIAGFADSLARPRGNMTGMTFMSPEMNAKRLELLREIMPDVRRVAVVANPEHPGEHLERAYLDETGRRLSLTLAHYPTRSAVDLTAAFEAMARDPPQALCVLPDGFAVQNRQAIIDFAMRQRVPVISAWLVFAQSGALFTYGPRLTASYQRLASYIDRLLKGAKPTDLPVERPTTFELIVNLKTARALGITMPLTLLDRADDVIE